MTPKLRRFPIKNQSNNIDQLDLNINSSNNYNININCNKEEGVCTNCINNLLVSQHHQSQHPPSPKANHHSLKSLFDLQVSIALSNVYLSYQ